MTCLLTIEACDKGCVNLEKLPSIKVRPTASAGAMTLTYDLDLQSPASYGHDLLTCKSSVNDQSVPKIEWQQTDRWMEAIALPPSLMR